MDKYTTNISIIYRNRKISLVGAFYRTALTFLMEKISKICSNVFPHAFYNCDNSLRGATVYAN